MFDLGWSKLVILAIIAIVVVGPKELPALLRTIGRFMAELRRHAADFRSQFDEAMRSPEIEQIKEDLNAVKRDAEEAMRSASEAADREMEDARRKADEVEEAARKAAEEKRQGTQPETPKPLPPQAANDINGSHVPDKMPEPSHDTLVGADVPVSPAQPVAAGTKAQS